MTREPIDAPRLLTPGEVARIFRVDPKTVSRWAKEGRLTELRTLGGHRRFYDHEVRALLSSVTGREHPADTPASPSEGDGTATSGAAGTETGGPATG
ncbi:BldC family transcriptional regulator [Terracoccus luteus]|uniref:Excisionase family DNA binding protein n=1 Tax=Terracoccus luteus TaxID=53356 RepID=A0A839PXP9_9MICO|nr:excisionase family DNA binding protein [Terracoccus luteus]MCP2173524.1 excisionase family DNA binding protein [Terracoccus luteus]